MSKEIIPIERVVKSIRWIRGQKVLFDSDLAALYGVTTGDLNKAFNRNRDRFPSDFMFQLSAEEAEDLIFQIGRSKGRGGPRHRELFLPVSPSVFDMPSRSPFSARRRKGHAGRVCSPGRSA